MPFRSFLLLATLAALWGGSFAFMRYAVPALGPVPLTFARVSLAAVVLFAIALARVPARDIKAKWRDFLVIGILNSATAVAYLIYFKLIADIGPSRALTVTFLIPLFGVAWGVIFLGEAVTPEMAGGGALIVAGTALALRAGQTRSAAEPSICSRNSR